MSANQEFYIQSLLKGDPKGLRQIYQEFLPRIRKLITTKGGSEQDAQDIFQNALILLYEKAQKPGFKLTSNFYTLLYGVSWNLWGNRLQKKSFKEVSIPENVKYSTDDDIQMDMERSEEQALFWEAFKELGEDCQRLMRLFFEKVKMEEIAEKMGYASVGYAKKRKFQCKEKLVGLVKEDVRFEELQRSK